MTHRQTRRLMAMALAGDANAALRAELDQHLSACATCAQRWDELTHAALAIERARPTAVATSADLAAAGLEHIRPRSVVREVRVRWAARAAAVALMIAAALWMTTRPPSKQALLARVEAALAVEPSYSVARIYGADDEQIYWAEQWRFANGDSYIQAHTDEGRSVFVHRPASRTTWRPREDGGYRVHWVGGDSEIQSQKWFQEAEERADEAGVPLRAGGHVRFLIGDALANGDELVEASERSGELDGQTTRVIYLGTQSTIPVERTRQGHDIEATIHLDRASGRLLRSTISFSGPGETDRTTVDAYPIRHDVEPPGSICTTIPEGTMVEMYGGIYTGEMVDPVWEHMSEAERARLTEVVRETIGGWARGDFAAFARHFDFAGITEYGVKGKFTPEQMAEHWRGDVQANARRFREWEMRVDYAVATADPPRQMLNFWSVYREGLPAGEGWITYRDGPTDEPGIVVFGRLTATTSGGETRYAGTLVVLKEINGDYRVIGWLPPF